MYGRRMLRGYLISKGFHISVGRIARAMQTVAPSQYESRRWMTIDKTNPIPYEARYFGHKLHCDQNEKLVMYGVTSFIARDGYSGKVMNFAVMPVKNSTAVYDLLYRYGAYVHSWRFTRTKFVIILLII